MQVDENVLIAQRELIDTQAKYILQLEREVELYKALLAKLDKGVKDGVPRS